MAAAPGRGSNVFVSFALSKDILPQESPASPGKNPRRKKLSGGRSKNSAP